MKKLLVVYARYTKEANEAVFAILKGIPFAELSADRGSYYKSLAGLASHIYGAAFFFHGIIRENVPAAIPFLKGSEGLPAPAKDIDEAFMRSMAAHCAAVDQATIDLIQGLSEKDLENPIKLSWFGGKPESVPLCFFLNMLSTHGTHHRGQISQILDSMGIEHDFSGLNPAFLN